MAKHRQLTALRDVLTHGLRELAIRVAQVDLSDDTPTEDEVRAFVSSVSDAAQKAAASGCVVPEHVAVFADPRMIAAALDPLRAGCRVQYAEGKTVLLAPPPPGYTLGSIAHEIDKAAQEATPTEPPKAAAKCVLCGGEGVHQCPGGSVPAYLRPMGTSSWDVAPGLVDASALPQDPTVEGPRAP